MKYPALLLAALTLAATLSLPGRAEPPPLPPGVKRVPVEFSGGHETDPRDHGRPVVLIAAALGVKPEVFREAFSQVRPASGGRRPEPEQVRQNKAALLSALRRHGVSNDRLDEVSNYYRYQPQRGELWTVQPAEANALVKGSTVVGYEIVKPGSGYSSPPQVTVPGVQASAAEVTLAFGKDLGTNGSVAGITAPKR